MNHRSTDEIYDELEAIKEALALSLKVSLQLKMRTPNEPYLVAQRRKLRAKIKALRAEWDEAYAARTKKILEAR
jgi:hypothetical protein